MKIAQLPGQQVDSGRSRRRESPEGKPKSLVESVDVAEDEIEPVPWDPSAIRGPADRLRLLVEKRGGPAKLTMSVP
jgi:hypothetical protein